MLSRLVFHSKDQVENLFFSICCRMVNGENKLRRPCPINVAETEILTKRLAEA